MFATYSRINKQEPETEEELQKSLEDQKAFLEKLSRKQSIRATGDLVVVIFLFLFASEAASCHIDICG